MKRRVVITGIGILCPVGIGIEDFWENSLDGKASVAPIPGYWFDYGTFRSRIWAPLPERDYESFDLNRVELMQLDETQRLALSAANLALKHAGISFSPGDRRTYVLDYMEPDRVGVHLGSGMGGVKSLFQATTYNTLALQKERVKNLAGQPANGAVLSTLDEIERKMIIPLRFSPFAVAMSMPNASAARIGIKYNLTGSNTTYCASCASGTIGVGKAFREIRAGRIDVALAGGVEYLADDYGSVMQAFETAGTLIKEYETPETANRPFDKKRSGFLFGEGGCCILVLEEFEHAAKRNARVIAEITGYAESFDAFSIMNIKPDFLAIRKMIDEALFEAEIAREDVDYINAHGTGTEVNDEIEAEVIEELFGQKPFVNTTKSLTGHTIAASGAIEAAVTALTVKTGRTHVCKNLDDPVRRLNYVTDTSEKPIQRGLSQSFGFGGHNAALVIEKCDYIRK